MAKDRKAAEKFILSIIEKLGKSSPNLQMYKDRFANMSDKEFDDLMLGLREEKKFLRFICPNFNTFKIDLKQVYTVIRSLGKEPFQRVWVPEQKSLTGVGGVPAYLTPNKYFIGHFPHCRQAQLLKKKISIPSSDRVVDQISGQATGDSKGAKVSSPEMHCMIAMNLENNLLEMMKVKGGDAGAYSAANAYVDRTGEFSIDQIMPYATGVQSGQALEQYFRAAHIKINVNEK